MSTYGTDGADNIVGAPGDNTIYARDGADTLTCADGNDHLRGGGGNDTLYGGAGNDAMDGGVGADYLAGGLGNDVYTIDNIGDTIMENAGEGYDTVLSTLSYTLGANLERLDLVGTADLSGWGNSLDNNLKGNSGANGLYGGAGNDSISGYDGNDLIMGGAGNDWLSGGAGNDTVSFADATGAVTVTLANTTSAQQTGGGGRDYLTGFENLTGSDFNDTLTGDAGANKLTGGLGVDTMSGGGGDDRYSVDNSADVVVEGVGGGIDQVLASADYVLGANIENLTLFNGAIRGTGNDLDNVIRGNANGNILNGGGGHDSLYGDVGADTFVFDAATVGSSDHVHDFQGGLDKVQISAATFAGGLTAGMTLDSSWFVTTSDGMPVDTNATRDLSTSDPFATTSAHGQFVYDGYHNLWWDADGSGAGQAVLISGFGTTPQSTLGAGDFIVGP